MENRTYIVANWKMHGNSAMADDLVEAVNKQATELPANAEVVLCPPATLLGEVSKIITGFNVRTGGQDCHEQPDGAFTGDISASMLRDAGCAYVIVGHSERRHRHNETNDMVRRKALRAISSNLTPIICVGETESERSSGQAEAVVERQIWESIPEEAKEGEFLLAYEPVWAIGSGQSATVADIRSMHHYITNVVSKKLGSDQAKVPVLYGGSVKGANAMEIMSLDDVSGVLVGGASLKAEEFCKIMAVAK
ncbi:MAG: triose-phosphate isomerase [Rickettsiales bacterium]